MAHSPDLIVTCAIIHQNGQVLCTQRGPGMSLPLKWEFPGGKLEPGEDARACIVREIEEELDLRIRIIERAPVVLHPYRPGKTLELIPFVAEMTGGTLHLHEHAAARWCKPGEMILLDWAQADIAVVNWWQDHRNRFL